MRNRIPFLLATWIFAALGQAAWAQSNAIAVTFLPASPTTSDQVYAELAIPECTVASARFGTLIGQPPPGTYWRTIELVTKACDGGSTAPFRLLLGFLQAGEYDVQVFVDSLPSGFYNVFTVTVPPPTPIVMRIETESPREYVPVAVRISPGCYSPVGTARPDSHTIILTVELLGCAGMPSPPIELGRFAAGSYRAILRGKGDPSDRASVDFTVAKGAAKLDYSDLWEVTGESGWGLTLKQHDLDRVFVVVYAYRADGRPLWLAMTGGEWESPTRFAGAVYRASGPVPANAGVATNKRVGTLRVDFDSPQSGTATFTREASDADLPATKTWRIGRLAF